MKQFKTEDGTILTEQDLHTADVLSKEEINDLLRLHIGGSILIDTIWVERIM